MCYDGSNPRKIMSTNSLSPPIVRAHSHIEVSDSCNCCCFNFRRKKKIPLDPEILRTDLKIVAAREAVFHAGKEVDPDAIFVSETK